MNLVQDPWLPFKLKSGAEETLPISAIAREDVLDFALPRADFQGAAYQFAIGLLQTTFAPEDQYSWKTLYKTPPSEAQLQQAFDTVAHAFNTVGDGPLFMQDFDVDFTVSAVPIESILIDAPGDSTRKKNIDHFVKRHDDFAMSLEMASLALFSTQVYGPAVGTGYRTGLRGGGPLTTLLLPDFEASPLWKKLWLNIINRNYWCYEEPDINSAGVFPWLAPTKTSELVGSEVYFTDVHELHMYWSMPQRIRLGNIGEGVCRVSGESTSRLVSSYRRKNKGYNYQGDWEHPLTPYCWNPKKPDEATWSVKAKTNGVTYRIWDILNFVSNEYGYRCAKAVSHYHKELSDFEIGVRLWAFGFHLESGDPKGWYSTEMPIFSIDSEAYEDVLLAVKNLQNLSLILLNQCTKKIKEAWFGGENADGSKKKIDIKGDVKFVDLAFWQRTESAFFSAVQQLVESASEERPLLNTDQAKAWLNALTSTAFDLFDEYALSELGSERSMAKRIKARQQLAGWLYGGKDIKRFKKEHGIEPMKETA